jgi:hypothetical protein
MEKPLNQSNQQEEENKELKRVQIIAKSYYARKDIQNAIYDFCQNRETVPRYLEGFGKRPDMLDFPQDIFEYAKKGATSFHCSEELWSSPLKISKELSPKELNDLKVGWDFLIDIDSKYLDYAKIAADLIIKVLEFNGVKNFGIKFSGSKGFHLIVPWKTFPEELNGIKTKEMFPEWARLLAGYVKETIKPQLTKKIFSLINTKTLPNKNDLMEVKCKKCNKNAIEQKIPRFRCRNCKAEMQNMNATTKKTLQCPNCKYDMLKIGEDKIYVCKFCNSNSSKNPDNFVLIKNVDSLIDSADIVLVSSRHLFRTPYSLHEKTALASIVLSKNDLQNFSPQMADPLKVIPKPYIPQNCIPGESTILLKKAIAWGEKKQLEKQQQEQKQNMPRLDSTTDSIVYSPNKNQNNFNLQSPRDKNSKIDIKNLKISEDYFPSCIKTILQGMKQDGRKRALFVLLTFFTSLNYSKEFISQKLAEWNKKNYKPLQEGYIQTQLEWHLKNKLMPPNCDKPYYKELGIQCICKNVKNPVSYTIREALKFSNNNPKNSKNSPTRPNSKPNLKPK